MGVILYLQSLYFCSVTDDFPARCHACVLILKYTLLGIYLEQKWDFKETRTMGFRTLYLPRIPPPARSARGTWAVVWRQSRGTGFIAGSHKLYSFKQIA